MKNFYKHYIYASFFGNFQHFSPCAILFAYGFCETISIYLYLATQRRIFQRLNVFLTLGENRAILVIKSAKSRVKNPENPPFSPTQTEGKTRQIGGKSRGISNSLEDEKSEQNFRQIGEPKNPENRPTRSKYKRVFTILPPKQLSRFDDILAQPTQKSYTSTKNI